MVRAVDGIALGVELRSHHLPKTVEISIHAGGENIEQAPRTSVKPARRKVSHTNYQ